MATSENSPAGADGSELVGEFVRIYKRGKTWYANFQNTYTGTQRCERGHVPLALNTGVGSQLGALYTNYRMLLGDPYTILVTV